MIITQFNTINARLKLTWILLSRQPSTTVKSIIEVELLPSRDTLIQVPPSSKFRVPSSAKFRQVPPSSAKFRQIPSSEFQVPSSEFQVPSSKFQVPSSAKFRQVRQVPSSKLRQVPSSAKFRQVPPNSAKFRQVPPSFKFRLFQVPSSQVPSLLLLYWILFNSTQLLLSFTEYILYNGFMLRKSRNRNGFMLDSNL